jgi:hypothetical protein
VSDQRRRGVRVLIDVVDAAPGIAFIAAPWGNVYELLELADGLPNPQLQ